MAASMGDWQRVNPRTYEMVIHLPDHWIAYRVVALIMPTSKHWNLFINGIHMTDAPTFEAIEDMVPIMINVYNQRTT